MGLSRSQKFELWFQQRNEYEERAWQVFKRRRAAEFPHLEARNELTWGWEFEGINDDGVNFVYREYGDYDHHCFDHTLLWDDEAVEQDLLLIRTGVEARKAAQAQRQVDRDLAQLARLKSQYEGVEDGSKSSDRCSTG